MEVRGEAQGGWESVEKCVGVRESEGGCGIGMGKCARMWGKV